MTVPVRVRRTAASIVVTVAFVVTGAPLLGLLGPAPSPAAAAGNSTTTTSPLRAPKTTSAQDTKFFTEVAEADPALASYEEKQQSVALRALLTDGAAFCALLTRKGGLDTALVEEATGARSSETQTHLPLSVTTFNTVESVALLRLCPSEQKLLPAATRTKIRSLGKTFTAHAG